MPAAYWTILVAGLLPYLTVAFAKAGAPIDNNHPRDQARTYQGFRARAYAAHQNHFEFFPFFAAGILVAERMAGSHPAVLPLALAILALRIAYTAAYLADRAPLRSALWAMALLGTISLFVLAAIGR